MRRWATALVWAMAGLAAAQAPLTVRSPDGRVVVGGALDADGALTYRIDYAGLPLIAPSAVGLVLAGGSAQGEPLGPGLHILATDRREGRDTYDPVHGKAAHVDDRYSELTIHAQERGGGRRIDLMLRAYDAGAAFRLAVPPQDGLAHIRLKAETSRFVFAGDDDCLGLNLGRYRTRHEGEFDPIPARLIRSHHLYDAPLVCHAANATFALAESDLADYAAAYFSGLRDGSPGVGIDLTPHPDNDGLAVDLPMPPGGFRTPWRVVMIAARPEQLIESNLIDDLATPTPLAETGWIRSGKAASDGGSAAAHDDAAYRRIIDFAARFGLPYMLIGDGWARDVLHPVAGVNMAALVGYAVTKKVGLWLSVDRPALERQLDEALTRYQQWGVRGIKVDLGDKQDQATVGFAHRLLIAAAVHHLMVDLHGGFVPRGLERTYPNLVTQGGVMGADYNLWSRRVTASHDVGLAFTRGLLGPMDYRPGGFRNVTPDAFAPRDMAPEVMTTRAHQLAMYVVSLSPFAVLPDTPDAYETADRKPVSGAAFLQAVPTSWDETRSLGGAAGHYVAVARRKGSRWYLGVLNDETARRVTIPLDMLGKGRWTIESWQDGDMPQRLRIARQRLDGRQLTIDLASGGGAAAVLTPG